MIATLKAKLKEAIEKFLDYAVEHNDRPDVYYYPELACSMADAAEAVYDAATASSVFTENEIVSTE